MLKNKSIYLSLLLAALVLSGCQKDDQPPSIKPGTKLTGDNVLFITMDTTRADRLGSYGFDKAITPTLDAIAKRGTQFDQAFSQVNLTFPSHCSMMTGKYPRELGVHINGRTAMGASYTTLAEVFKKNGYETSAFVASFVLDSRFGLDRGFDFYEDDMEKTTFETQPLQWQIPANLVVDRALSWLNDHKDKSFFCWVHFYDPHEPYNPPTKFIRKDVHPYNSEITFMDSQIKLLVDWLAVNGLTDHTLVVVVGDHGESLKRKNEEGEYDDGEHGEAGHTNFLYSTHIHVPLIFAHPKVVPTGKRVNDIVEVVDLFPTLLDLFGWQPPQKLFSRSLTRVFVGESMEPRPSYAESQYVFNSYGWAEQRSLTTSRWKYISTTKPELYDRQSDPGELKNLINDKPEVAQGLLDTLITKYLSLIPGESSEAALDPQTQKSLESLGYTGTGVESKEFLSSDRLDPKDMKMILTRYHAAREIIKGSETPEEIVLAIPLLENIVQESPQSVVFRFLLGKTYLSMDEPAKAIEQCQEALNIDNTYDQAIVLIGDALLSMKDYAGAKKQFEMALEINEHHPEVCVRLAEIMQKEGKRSEAIKLYKKAVEYWPGFVLAHVRLGAILIEIRDYQGAIHHYKEAVSLKPEIVEYQYNLGVLVLGLGQIFESIPYFRETVRLQPDHGKAMMNLAQGLMAQGARDEAKKWMQKAVKIPGVAPQAHFNLGLLLSQENNQVDAVTHYKKAIELDPAFENPYIELVACLYSEKKYAQAKKTLRSGTKHIPQSVRLANTLAKLLATCMDDSVRDGSVAIRYAQQASAATGGKHPVVLGTLANAYAEAGNLEKAIEVVQQAIQIATTTGQQNLTVALQSQLEGYRQGRPHRNKQF